CTGDFCRDVHGIFLHRVEVKEWLNTSSTCAKVNLQSGVDPKWTSLRLDIHKCLWLTMRVFLVGFEIQMLGFLEWLF
ncbi:hypothetical protein ACT3TT_17640, partial [Halomonas sp. AOP42-A1-14]